MSETETQRQMSVPDPPEIAESLRRTSFDEPWSIGREPRDGRRVAIKSGVHTVLTIGDYYDGGSDEQEAALTAIVDAVNFCFLCRV